jgi:hypothetical protein
VPTKGRTKTEQLFHAIFSVQLAVLERALVAGVSEPSFLSPGGRLKASDSMIY